MKYGVKNVTRIYIRFSFNYFCGFCFNCVESNMNISRSQAGQCDICGSRGPCLYCGRKERMDKIVDEKNDLTDEAIGKEGNQSISIPEPLKSEIKSS